MMLNGAIVRKSNEDACQTSTATQCLLAKDLRPKRLSRWQGWRFGVAVAAAAACTVLLTNILFVIVVAAKSPTDDGIATVHEGDCKVVTYWSTGLHVLINILSSALLAASNYTMQCLAAPSRKEIENAHGQSDWLDIGLPSLHNMIHGYLPTRRVVAWWMLCLSSLPIHFVFNSVLFKATAVLRNVDTDLVTPAMFKDQDLSTYNRWSHDVEWNCTSAGSTFDSCWHDGKSNFCFDIVASSSVYGPAWNNSASYYCASPGDSYDDFEPAPQARNATWSCKSYSPFEPNPDDATKTYNCSLGLDKQIKYRKLKLLLDSLPIPKADNLTKSECISAYARRFISDRGPLTLVTNDLRGKDKVGYIGERWDYSDDYGQNPYDWMCPYGCADTIIEEKPVHGCNFSCKSGDIDSLQNEVQKSGNWTISTAIYDSSDYGAWWEADVHSRLNDIFQIDYCLSPRVSQRCKLQLSFHLFAIVIVCNFVKAAAMLWTLLTLRSTTLITIGDAITSFLDSPDQVLHNSPTDYIAPNHEYSVQTRRRWHHAVGKRRWLVTFGVCSISVLLALALLIYGVQQVATYPDRMITSQADARPPLYRGFSELDPQAFIDFGNIIKDDELREWAGTSSLILVVLLVNLPQVICSVVYFTYNYVLTMMLLAREWSQYYLIKRPLRVSDPRGEQKSTYFLTVPYRYGIPLIVASTTLHWLISQSIFLARIETLSFDWETMELDAKPDTRDMVSRGVYSCKPMLLAVLLAFVMLLVLVAMGFRKLPGHMPIAGSSSRAIVSMCKRPEDDTDAAYLPVSWGELEHKSPDDPCHCCFTSKEVRAPCSTSNPQSLD